MDWATTETAYDLKLLKDTKIIIDNSCDYDLSLIPKTFININENSLNYKDRLIDTFYLLFFKQINIFVC